MKSIKMFGKSVPLLAIVVISLLAVGASAVLLTSYGLVSLSGSITQSVTITPTDDDMSSVVGGETICKEHVLTNAANVDVSAKLYVATHSGITVAFMNTVHLTEKSGFGEAGAWDDVAGMEADIHYTVVADDFAYDINATGLTADTDYMLIYYADEPDRFVEWGGNPARNLGVYTSSGAGEIHDSSINTGVPDLPYSDDWNNGPDADYGVSDGYYHKTGAKLWLILADDWTGTGTIGALNTWNPAEYLFETDLVRYFESPDTLTIPAEDSLKFDFCYTFPAAYTGTTTVTVDVQPVS